MFIFLLHVIDSNFTNRGDPLENMSQFCQFSLFFFLLLDYFLQTGDIAQNILRLGNAPLHQPPEYAPDCI